jgi:hypothetical protein
VKRTLATVVPTCAVVALVVLVSAGPAAAKKPSSQAPCWKALINDWYDGRIDRTYPIPCYHEAIKHLPSDVQAYSSAADDIRRALQERISGKKELTPMFGAGGSAGGPGGKLPSGGSGAGGLGGGTGGRKPPGGGPVGVALNAGSPSHADSVPIPLIVLAAIAGLLLAAGTAGFVARRVQARRVPVRQGDGGIEP